MALPVFALLVLAEVLYTRSQGRNAYALKDFGGSMYGEGGSVLPQHATQGQLGDCYFIAGMAATARANGDDIKKLIKDNGDGTFDVTLYLRETAYSNPVPVTRTVDMRLPTTGSKPLYGGMGNTDELWPAILEKRFAMEMGGYGNIEGGTVDGLMKGNWGASEILRGKPERYFSTGRLSDDQALRMFEQALEADKPITVDSLNMADDAALAAEAKKWNVYGNHAYAVEAALEGQTDVMAGIHAQKRCLVPLEKTWEERKSLDEYMVRVQRLLA